MDAVRHAASVGQLHTLIPSWTRSLRAVNRARKTIETYREAADQLVRFLRERGMPTEAAKVRREHIEAFIEHLLETRSPATAANRYRGLQSLFKWLESEGKVAKGRNPMENMSPPHVPEKPIPVVADDDIRKLLTTCSSRSFDDVRDEASARRRSVRGPENRRRALSIYQSSGTPSPRIATVVVSRSQGADDRFTECSPEVLRVEACSLKQIAHGVVSGKTIVDRVLVNP